MLIRHQDGSTTEAVLVSLAGTVMRVAVPNAEDFLEFTLAEGRWISEQYEAVTFEFPTVSDRPEEFRTAVAESCKPPANLPGCLDSAPESRRSVN